MLQLGMMGMSPGNGHPYSWSAIINGDYDEKAMANCGYAGIPVYLAANRDTLGIEGAQVTHVWTQDQTISMHIACCEQDRYDRGTSGGYDRQGGCRAARPR